MEAQSTIQIPKVAIRFCTQCKWNLRAAYYAQELLQTFSTSLGEISLIPCTGGIFTVTLYHQDTTTTISNSDDIPASTSATADSTDVKIKTTQIWDRKADGGFPETKELKNRVRNVIEPDRDMGHIDRSLKKGSAKDGKDEAGKTEISQQAKDVVESEGKREPVVSSTPAQQDGANGADSKEACEDCR